MVYEIFEGNFERLEKKLNRIGNKCKKYGCDFCFSVIGETFREVIDESTKENTLPASLSLKQVEQQKLMIGNLLLNWNILKTATLSGEQEFMKFLKDTIPESLFANIAKAIVFVKILIL